MTILKELFVISLIGAPLGALAYVALIGGV